MAEREGFTEEEKAQNDFEQNHKSWFETNKYVHVVMTLKLLQIFHILQYHLFRS